MKRAAILLIAMLVASRTLPQSPPPERSFFSRILHPFGSSRKAPKYQDPRLRGLLLEVEGPSQAVRLSEVRQLHLIARLSNMGPFPVTLDFPTSQRIDIQLLNSGGEILTKWSENHAFTQENGTLLINPHEQIIYDETIATRELQPGKVYAAEVFFPKYPELRVRQKFMTAP
jgi:hypothetical protein